MRVRRVDERWSFWLPGVSQRLEREWKTYVSVQMIDGREGKSYFSQIMGPFFTASNAQTIKVKSIFHKWEDHMI